MKLKNRIIASFLTLFMLFSALPISYAFVSAEAGGQTSQKQITYDFTKMEQYSSILTRSNMLNYGIFESNAIAVDKVTENTLDGIKEMQYLQANWYYVNENKVSKDMRPYAIYRVAGGTHFYLENLYNSKMAKQAADAIQAEKWALEVLCSENGEEWSNITPAITTLTVPDDIDKTISYDKKAVFDTVVSENTKFVKVLFPHTKRALDNNAGNWFTVVSKIICTPYIYDKNTTYVRTINYADYDVNNLVQIEDLEKYGFYSSNAVCLAGNGGQMNDSSDVEANWYYLNTQATRENPYVIYEVRGGTDFKLLSRLKSKLITDGWRLHLLTSSNGEDWVDIGEPITEKYDSFMYFYDTMHTFIKKLSDDTRFVKVVFPQTAGGKTQNDMICIDSVSYTPIDNTNYYAETVEFFAMTNSNINSDNNDDYKVISSNGLACTNGLGLTASYDYLIGTSYGGKLNPYAVFKVKPGTDFKLVADLKNVLLKKAISESSGTIENLDVRLYTSSDSENWIEASKTASVCAGIVYADNTNDSIYGDHRYEVFELSLNENTKYVKFEFPQTGSLNLWGMTGNDFIGIRSISYTPYNSYEPKYEKTIDYTSEFAAEQNVSNATMTQMGICAATESDKELSGIRTGKIGGTAWCLAPSYYYLQDKAPNTLSNNFFFVTYNVQGGTDFELTVQEQPRYIRETFAGTDKEKTWKVRVLTSENGIDFNNEIIGEIKTGFSLFDWGIQQTRTYSCKLPENVKFVKAVFPHKGKATENVIGNDMLGISKVSYTPADCALAPPELSAPEITLKNYGGATVYAELSVRLEHAKLFYRKSGSESWLPSQYSGAVILENPGTYEFVYSDYSGNSKSEISSVTVGSSNGIVFTLDNGVKKAIGLSSNDSLIEVPTEITCIGKGAFKNAGYAEIVIPNTVTNIEAGAFGNKSQGIYMSSGAKILDSGVFDGLTKDTTVYAIKNSSAYSAIKGLNITAKLSVVPELGDSNGDWTIDIRDLVSIKKKSSLAGKISVLETADVNSDGFINASDIAILRKSLIIGLPISYVLTDSNF